MEKDKIELAKRVLENTTAYMNGSISFYRDGDTLKVWNNNTSYGVFNSTEIIPLFIHPYYTYLTFDPEREKTVLCIF